MSYWGVPTPSKVDPFNDPVSSGMPAAAGGTAQTRRTLKPLPRRGDSHGKAVLAEATLMSAEVT